MLLHRTRPVHALVIAATVASLGVPITTPGVTPNRAISLSNAVHHPFHGEQYRQYRRACYRLAFMARSIQETTGVLGALGSPVKLTCGIALSLVQALHGMVVNRQMCSEIAESITRHLTVIREELGGAAKGDANFRCLVENYAEALREVSQGLALIAHRRRLSQLVHHHSEFEELLEFKSKLDTAFQAFMFQCGLQTRQMQGHVAANQKRIVENHSEQSCMTAALNEKVERVLEKFDRIMEHHGNLEQFIQTLAGYFHDSRVMPTHSLARNPIDLLTPTIPIPIPIFVQA